MQFAVSKKHFIHKCLFTVYTKLDMKSCDNLSMIHMKLCHGGN